MPNSILWIGLVVLWVFVLFPILANRHPRIRRTTDAALATRVLHRGDSKRRIRRGHVRGRNSDSYRRSTRAHRKRHHSNDVEDRMTTPADEPVTEAGEQTADSVDPIVDTVDDLAPEQAGGPFDDVHDDLDPETADEDFDDTAYDRVEPAKARIPPARSPAPMDRAFDVDEEPDDEFDFVPHRRGRGGFDPEADAIARATRYTFRQRAVLALLLGLVGCGGLAVATAPGFWWGTALTATVLVAYLAYLRRQVRMEEDIRRRRSGRLNRDREHDDEPRETEYVSHLPQRGMDRDTARALRHRSELLDFDDEDPLFEHLDPYDATAARLIRHRAEGGDIRRAAGA